MTYNIYRLDIRPPESYWRERRLRAGNRRLAPPAERGGRRHERPFEFDTAADVGIDPIVNHENLLKTYRLLEAEGGQAPGYDRLHYGSLGRRERADVLRAVERRIRAGEYRPGRSRRKSIRKASGGTRELRLRSVVDRTVSKAVAIAVTPIIDATFLVNSVGFRPGIGTFNALAELKRAVEGEQRYVIGHYDIRDAFGHVDLAAAVTAFGHHVQDPGLLRLIEIILRGGDADAGRQQGLDQGDPLSPLALNTQLDQVLDRPLVAAAPGTPFRRYADNIVWAARDVRESERLRDAACELLRPHGFQLRPNPGIVDLRRQGARTTILGFDVRLGADGRLHFGAMRSGWRKLRQGLNMALHCADPSRKAYATATGWIGSLGPALSTDAERTLVVMELLRIAARKGLRELGTAGYWMERADKAFRRWDRIVSSVHSTLLQTSVRAPRDATPRSITSCGDHAVDH